MSEKGQKGSPKSRFSKDFSCRRCFPAIFPKNSTLKLAQSPHSINPSNQKNSFSPKSFPGAERNQKVTEKRRKFLSIEKTF